MTDISHRAVSVEATTTTSVGDVAGPARAIPATPAKDHGGGRRRWVLRIGGGAIAVFALIAGVRWVHFALDTVSTDDAYVNGHVTFVAAHVPGQVMPHFCVDDNNRVHKGDLLVQLDKEPYQVPVDVSQAAVTASQADLVAAYA